MGDNTVVIESVEVIRGEGHFDPSVRAAIEKLITRWLVRAYIRKYGSGEDEAYDCPVIPAQAGIQKHDTARIRNTLDPRFRDNDEDNREVLR